MTENPRLSDELGVVFDMDGVLVHSTPCHSQAFAEILNSLGISNFVYSRFAGWRTSDVFRTVFLEAGLPMTEEKIAECSRNKSARSKELLERTPGLFTSCAPGVTRLAAHYPLALASSGSRSSVETFLDKSGLRTVFKAVISGDDVSHAKPNPEVFSRAIGKLALAPSRCVVVEDAAAGVQAALAAGALACGFGADADGILKQAGARWQIRDLSELPSILESLRQS